MRPVLSCLACLPAVLALAPTPAPAHVVHHRVDRGDPWVVALSYGDGSPFAGQAYEIRRKRDGIVVQRGRTDERGRIPFPADRIGPWVCRAFAEDGHGVEFEFGTETLAGNEDDSAEELARPPWLAQAPRALAGVVIVFALFGLLTLHARRR